MLNITLWKPVRVSPMVCRHAQWQVVFIAVTAMLPACGQSNTKPSERVPTSQRGETMLLENLRSDSETVRRRAMFALVERDSQIKEVVDTYLDTKRSGIDPFSLLGDRALPHIYERLISGSLRSSDEQDAHLLLAATDALVTLESNGISTALRGLYGADSGTDTNAQENTHGNRDEEVLRVLRTAIAADGTTRLETIRTSWTNLGLPYSLALVAGTRQDRQKTLDKTSKMIDSFKSTEWTIEVCEEKFGDVIGITFALSYAAKACRDDREAKRICDQCSSLLGLKFGFETNPLCGLLDLAKWKATDPKQPQLLAKGLSGCGMHDYPLSTRIQIELIEAFATRILTDDDASWILSVLQDEQAGRAARCGALHLFGYGAVGAMDEEVQRTIVELLDSPDKELRSQAAIALDFRPSAEKLGPEDVPK